MSSRVMDVLSRFTPDLEIYSIDEAFLGMGGFGARLAAEARALRAAVLQWIGIPVSIDIAPTKTLAKPQYQSVRWLQAVQSRPDNIGCPNEPGGDGRASDDPDRNGGVSGCR
jgi:nucleotidyltransferase/DNA polymerase involved in DNA repair